MNQTKRMKQGLKFKSKAQLTGTLAIYKTYETSEGVKKVLHFKKKNVITLTATQRILAGVYLTNTSDPVTTLHIGVGGTLDPEGLYPKPVTQNLTGLYNDYATIPVTYTIAPTVPSVTFVADADEGTANGQLVSEAGLFTLGGVMFNIKTFPGIDKTAEFGIHFEWTISLA